MVELKDFITTMQTNMDSYILNEASKGILNYSIKIAIDVNEERCKEWIRQAMEIETFTKEQIEDLKVRNLFEKLEKENEKLKHELEVKDLALRNACETIKEIMPNKPMYICGGAIAERLGISQTSEIKDYDYFIEQAKENKL